MQLTVSNHGTKCSLDTLRGELRFRSTKRASAIVGRGLALAVLSALLLIAVQPAHAQTETVLYNFGGQSGDGTNPYAGLVIGKKSNLYGTNWQGGAYGEGTVFELTPTGEETVLHSFPSQSGDGAYPYAALIMDAKGNLYGTTVYGGASDSGTVFKVSPPAKKGGAWTETLLYSFGSQSGDGGDPYGGLIMDKEGNLYGTTYFGPGYFDTSGTVFKVTPSGEESVLYTFGSQTGDGCNPRAGLIMDKKGNLYGTTYYCGAHGLGTVFKVTPSGEESVLYNFGSQPGDGAYPAAGLIMDKKSNLYGTTWYGGALGLGSVFELSAKGEETVLYSFTNSDNDGYGPYAGLVMDKTGNLYGATSGGSGSNYGVLFELMPGQGGAWSFTTLHAFNSGDGDGLEPYGTPILDTEGNLYGTTVIGGAYSCVFNGVNSSCGTVFKVTP